LGIRLIQFASIPYFDLLKSWIYFGVLQDWRYEFFIEQDGEEVDGGNAILEDDDDDDFDRFNK